MARTWELGAGGEGEEIGKPHKQVVVCPGSFRAVSGPPAVLEQQLTVPCHPQGQPGVDDICDTVSPSLAERNRGQSVKGEGAVA